MDYLQQLLNNQPVEWKKLGEVAENMDYLRKPITSGNRVSGNYPYYGASGIVDYVDNYIFDGDFLLVSEDGANLVARKTPIAFSISGKNWVNNHAHVLQGLERVIDNRFLSFSLVRCDIEVLLVGGGRSKLNANTLMNDITLTEDEAVVEVFKKLRPGDQVTVDSARSLIRQMFFMRLQSGLHRYLHPLLYLPKFQILFYI